MDLSAAFDLVAHEQLLRKLKALGFSESAIQLIRSYLTDREVFAEIETGESKVLPITKCGVPQGSILGPLLYLIYIYDITEVDENMKIIYADDTNAIITANTDLQLQQETDKAMANLIEYYSKCELKLNPSKTELINHNAKIKSVSVLVDQENNERKQSVNDARMLGVQVDSELSFARHIDKIVSDVESKLKMFSRLTRGASLKSKKIFAQGILVSKIAYALPCYAGATKVQLNRVKTLYNTVMRVVLGLRKEDMVRTETMRKELGWLSFHGLIEFYDITVLATILKTGVPVSLSKYIEQSKRDSRSFNKGNCRINYTAKTQKTLRSFLFRSVQTFNKLPKKLKVAFPKNYSKLIRDYLFEHGTA